MKLYGGLASPYVARVAMFASLKGIDLPIAEVPGGMGSDEYKKINPTGKIPSLLVDDQCIAESEVICEFLEAKFPEPALIPGDATGRAQTKMISRLTDFYVAPHNTPLRNQKDPASRDQAVVDRQAANFAEAFMLVEHFMGPGPFAVGQEPTLGDCALAPFIGMLKQTVFPHFLEIPDPTDGNGRLGTWWRALQDDAICQQAIQQYDTALREFLKWLAEMMARRAQQGG